MKIVFMGTPEIAIDSLESIISAGHDVLAVVTQPDRPKGRGKSIVMSPVKEVALNHGIRVIQPQKASDPLFVQEIRDLSPDLIVVEAFGQILKKDLLEVPRFGCVNIHVSLLPRLRGAAPINWTLINGDKKTGVTTMFMDEGLDTGDIIMAKEFELDDEINAGQLHDWMKVEGAKLLIETIKAIESGSYPRIKQDDSLSTYAPMMDKNLGHIDFEKDSRTIHNLVRGVVPWPGAWCESEYGKIKIWKTRMEEERLVDGKVGEVIDVSKNGIFVICGKGVLVIEELQMPNKKRMPVSEFIKGNKIDIGTVLY